MTAAEKIDAKLKVRQRFHIAERGRSPTLLDRSVVGQELTRRSVCDPVADGVEVRLIARRVATSGSPAQGIDRIVRAHDAAGLIDPEGRRNISDVVEVRDR